MTSPLDPKAKALVPQVLAKMAGRGASLETIEAQMSGKLLRAQVRMIADQLVADGLATRETTGPRPRYVAVETTAAATASPAAKAPEKPAPEPKTAARAATATTTATEATMTKGVARKDWKENLAAYIARTPGVTLSRVGRWAGASSVDPAEAKAEAVRLGVGAEAKAAPTKATPGKRAKTQPQASSTPVATTARKVGRPRKDSAGQGARKVPSAKPVAATQPPLPVDTDAVAQAVAALAKLPSGEQALVRDIVAAMERAGEGA